jgi:hypothetical protein
VSRSRAASGVSAGANDMYRETACSGLAIIRCIDSTATTGATGRYLQGVAWGYPWVPSSLMVLVSAIKRASSPSESCNVAASRIRERAHSYSRTDTTHLVHI